MANLAESMRIAAISAVEAGKPVALIFGKVISIYPLQINVEQKLTLGCEQLVLTRNVTDYSIDMTVNHSTEKALDVEVGHNHTFTGTTENGGNEAHKHAYSASTQKSLDRDLSHFHKYVGKKKFLFHNALDVGETVLLLRMQGGQKFMVLDRVIT